MNAAFSSLCRLRRGHKSRHLGANHFLMETAHGCSEGASTECSLRPHASAHTDTPCGGMFCSSSGDAGMEPVVLVPRTCAALEDSWLGLLTSLNTLTRLSDFQQPRTLLYSGEGTHLPHLLYLSSAKLTWQGQFQVHDSSHDARTFSNSSRIS